jgi:hypothetical protein
MVRYRLLTGLMLKDVDSQLLVFNPEKLEVHELNPSMAAVARLCDGEHCCEKIVMEFATEFAINVEDSAREVYRALALLLRNNLIESL